MCCRIATTPVRCRAVSVTLLLVMVVAVLFVVDVRQVQGEPEGGLGRDEGGGHMAARREAHRARARMRSRQNRAGRYADEDSIPPELARSFPLVSVLPDLPQVLDSLRHTLPDLKNVRRGCAMEPRPLVHYHIPKAAGGSLNQALTNEKYGIGLHPTCWQCFHTRMNYTWHNELPMPATHAVALAGAPPVSRRMPYHPCDDLVGDPARFMRECNQVMLHKPGQQRKSMLNRHAFRTMIGHFWWPADELLSHEPYRGVGGKKPVRLTALREPMEQTVSLYLYAGCCVPSMRKFISGHSCVWFVENLDRFVGDYRGILQYVEPLHPYIAMLCGLSCEWGVARGVMTPEDATIQAIRNVHKHFDVVGTSNNMTDMLHKLRYRVAGMSGVRMMAQKHISGQRGKKTCWAALRTPEGQAAIKSSKVLRQLGVFFVAMQELSDAHTRDVDEHCVHAAVKKASLIASGASAADVDETLGTHGGSLGPSWPMHVLSQTAWARDVPRVLALLVFVVFALGRLPWVRKS